MGFYPTAKMCSACSEVKFITDFHARGISADGLAFKCKPCQSSYDETWRARNIEKKKSYDREYRASHKDEAKVANKRYYQNNRERILGRMKVYYQANPAKIKKKARNWNLLKQYGITREEYDAMLLAQGGLCEMCSKPESGKRGGTIDISLAVDHDHVTGKVRGLLCFQCNTFLGRYESGQKELAILYLEKYA